MHRPEQQVVAPPSPPQGLPAVAHELLSGVQVLLVPHLPLQQAPELVQAWLSATQLVAVAQTWLVVHWRLQQSVFTPQAPPGAAQVVTDDVQACVP
jgi:hypothetical protein